MALVKKIILSFTLARWHYTPVIIVPVLVGSFLAWYQGYPLRWIDMMLCLAGSFFAHLGANAVNDCFDDISGVDRIAFETIPENRGSTVCGSGVLTQGLLTRREGFIATAIFFFLALACGLPLMLRLGWPIVAFAVSGFLLATFYCAQPISFGYIGRGLGEVGIFIAFGPLPVVGSYWVQAGNFSWSAVWASVPAGLMTVSVLYNHHFTHPSADAKVGKMSPVVVLGERGARNISPLILGAAYIALVANVVAGVFPYAALAALVTAPFIFIAYARLHVPSRVEESVQFLFNVVKTNVATGALTVMAIIAAKVF